MPEISIPVPEDRVAEFYQFFGLWLGGSLARSLESPKTPQDSAQNSVGSVDKSGWVGADAGEDAAQDDAEELWRKMNKRARSLLGLMIDNPSTRYTGEELATTLAIPNGANGVAGVLAWPGRYCLQLNRHLPTQWKDGEDGAPSVYWMDQEVARLFAKARAIVEG